jgi:GPH family glycoside/pentoside/hexuronide:cation symporter
MSAMATTTAGGVRHLTRRHLRGYATGAIASGVFSTVPGLLLLYFLTDALGVGTGLAGILVLAPKIWDVLINPVVGLWSDRLDQRPGKSGRTPLFYAGAVVLPVGLAVMFAVPHLPLWATAVWVVLAYAVCATGYSLYAVPYAALPAEITDDYDERSRVNAWKIVVLTIGILISGGLAPAIEQGLGGGRAGYAVMGLVVGLIVLVTALYSAREMAKIPIVRVRAAAGGLRAQWAMLRANRMFSVLMAVYFGQALAIGAQLAGEPYFATYALHNTGATSVIFVALVGPALLVMPLWLRRCERGGKSRTLIEASVIYAIASACTAFGPDLPLGVTALVSAVIGVGFAGMQMVPYAMLPDVIDDGVGDDGEGQAGALSGVWIAFETLGFALGPTLLAVVLSIGHFHSTVDAHRVPQTAAALDAVRYGFALLPPFLLLITLPLLRFYRVDSQRRAVDTDTLAVGLLP